MSNVVRRSDGVWVGRCNCCGTAITRYFWRNAYDDTHNHVKFRHTYMMEDSD